MDHSDTKITQSPLALWFLAARPKTLPAAAAPVIMGTAMALADGHFHLPAALMALLGALLIQIGTNFANDYYDFKSGADNEKRLGPTRATQAGWVAPGAMKRAFILVFTLAFISGMYLVWRGGWPVLAIGIFSILCGILYTGGPYPLGYNGWADCFVLIFFGPVAVGGTYYVQALEIPWLVLLAGLAPGLISTALLTVNNLRDVHTDRIAGKRTLVVRFGVGFGRMEYLLCLLAAAAIPAVLVGLTGRHKFALLASAAILLALPDIRTVLRTSGDPVLNRTLGNTGRYLFVFSVLFSLGWVVG